MSLLSIVESMHKPSFLELYGLAKNEVGIAAANRERAEKARVKLRGIIAQNVGRIVTRNGISREHGICYKLVDRYLEEMVRDGTAEYAKAFKTIGYLIKVAP